MTHNQLPASSMLTVAEVAQRLNVSRRLIYKLVSSGKLKVYRIGGAIRVTLTQLAEYLRSCEETNAIDQSGFRHLDL